MTIQLNSIIAAGGDIPEMAGDLKRPVFSTDSKRVFFQSALAVVTGAIAMVDLADLSKRFVGPGNSLELIRCGEYRDHLIVQKHKYFLGGGSYDWYWLLSPDGKEIAPIGENTAFFKDLYVKAECLTN